MEGLGINWKILVGQLIHFAILLYVLKRFAYKPFFSILEKRRSQIEEGVKKSAEAEEMIQKTRSLSDKIRKKCEEEAGNVFKEMEEKAKVKANSIIESAQEERKSLIDAARRAMDEEKVRGKEGQEREARELSILLSERILRQKIDQDKDKDLIENILSDLSASENKI
jgi:F-type H+-transporting ATPase subunit b